MKVKLFQTVKKKLESSKNDIMFLVTSTCCIILAIVVGIIGLLHFVNGNWKNWQPATCLRTTPPKCFCERLDMESLIIQPTNTWTNVSFIIIGLLIFVQTTRDLLYKEKKDDFAWYSIIYAIGNIILGVTSAFYHASFSFYGQFLDNIGMFFIVLWCCSYNFVRLVPNRIKRNEFIFLYAFLILIAGYVNLFMPDIRRHAFGVAIAIYIVQQIVIDLIKKPWETGIEYFYWIGGFVTIALAFLIWNLDQNGLCDPNSILQGHGLWHVLNAVVCYFLFLFYRSEVLKPKRVEYETNMLIVHNE